MGVCQEAIPDERTFDGKRVRSSSGPLIVMKFRGAKMPEWLVFLLVFAAYFVLMRWALPAMGVQT